MSANSLSVRLLFAVILSGVTLISGMTSVRTFPSGIVRYVVPDTPGSGGDVMGRIIANAMTESFSQQMIVDNRAGACSNLGAEFVARAPADGYTMLAVSTTLSANASLYKNLSYDLGRDFAPVTQLALTPHVLIVHPSLPVKTVAEFIKLAKSQSGTINYSSPGSGASAFIPAEIFRRVVEVNIVHGLYKGDGPALQAVVSGEVQSYFAPVLTARPQIKQGTVRPLALTSMQRLPLLSDLQTLAELGVPGTDFPNSLGLMVPAKTSPENIAILHRTAVTALKKPEVAKRINELGAIVVASSPADYGAFVKKEMVNFG